ncbi:MAG: ATP-dependent DNA ligase LigA [Haloferacaceae archaeon]
MDFAEFAARADEIEAEEADLETVSLVRDLLLAAGEDLPIVARFVQGRVFPAWDSTTLDVGPSLCYEAIARAAGPNVSAADVEDRLADVGEIGEVAASYDFGGQRGLAAFGGGSGSGDAEGSGLTVAETFAELTTLATAAGSGSQDRKLDVLFGLFNRTDPTEARYLARIVLSEMRIGVGEGTVRDAVAEAFDAPVEAVERALQVTNDYGRVAEIARDEGVEGLDAVDLQVGRPVQAMLAQAGTVTDALEEWESAAVETKYDGARVQVHHDPDGIDAPERIAVDAPERTATPTRAAGGGPDAEARTTALFSRNMEDVTAALPEVVEFVEKTVSTPAILDGEVVAVDDAGDPLPFQAVLRRIRRKHDVDRVREEVTVELRAFDCLHAGGEDLLTAPLTERHGRLAAVVDDEASVSDLLLSAAPDEIAAVEEAALEAGHEGIMLKDPDAAYSPGKRGKNWLKRKPDVETLDLVVTGAEWGEGRRANFLGTFLLSARVEGGGQSQEDADFVTLGKVATGITDEKLAELTDLLEPHVRREDGREVDIEPAVVFEVGYEEIQASPTYSSGYALRFPRFVAVREDKTPDTADTLRRVERLAANQ